MTGTFLLAALLAVPYCPEPPRDALVIGHRGSGASSAENAHAENTLPSMLHALDAGADMVELDAQLTADGVPVLMHDFTLQKTTDLHGCLAERTYAELATADASLGSGAAAASIPTLREVLDAVAARDAGAINIELKVNTGGACPVTDLDALAAAVASEVLAAGMRERVVYSSFSWEMLEAMLQEDADAKVAFLTTTGGEELTALQQEAADAGFYGLNPIYFVVSEDEDTWRGLLLDGARLSPWTVNDRPTMRRLFAGGVYGLITDHVADAIEERAAADAEHACSTAGDVTVEEEVGCSSAGGASGWLLMASALWLTLRRLRRHPAAR